MTIRSRIAVLGLLVLAAGLGLPAGRGPDAQPAGLVRAIDAVGMTVADMDRSIAFYHQVLGFETVSDVEVWGKSMSGWKECSGSGCASCGCVWATRRSS